MMIKKKDKMKSTILGSFLNLFFIFILIILEGCNLKTQVRAISSPILNTPISEPNLKNPRPNQIVGCDIPFAKNYEPEVTKRDGSCLFEGCFDKEDSSYNSQYESDIRSYSETFEKNFEDIFVSKCVGIHGCKSIVIAKNYNANATIEDGSCKDIEICRDSNYEEFEKSKDYISLINNYVEKFGKFLPPEGTISREMNSCKNQKKYCLHPDGINYLGRDPAPGELIPGAPFCEFVACNILGKVGYAKFKEFEEYLKDHPGAITIDNSDRMCGPNTRTGGTKEVEVTKTLKTENVKLVFAIDDSGSMSSEIIGAIKSLKEVANLIKDYEGVIGIDLQKLSWVDANQSVVKTIDPNGHIIVTTKYLFPPKPFASLEFGAKTDITIIQNKLNEMLNTFKVDLHFGYERPLCNHLRTLKGFSENSGDFKAIGIINIGDEGDNGVSDCALDKVEVFNPQGVRLSTVTNSLIPSGRTVQDLIIDEITKLSAKEKIPGTLSIVSNINEVICSDVRPTTQAVEYLLLNDQLKKLGFYSDFLNICYFNKYTAVIKAFLDRLITSSAGLSYNLGPDKQTEILEVKLVLKDGSELLLLPEYYRVTIEQGNVILTFKETIKSKLLEATKILIKYSEI